VAPSRAVQGTSTRVRDAMTVELEEWQSKLEHHFGQLAGSRNSDDFPLFALEHGLDQDSLRAIARLLHGTLAYGTRLSRHWLVWVVYATELGYDYDGEEYWQTFEERTPRWHEVDRRGQLRVWFRKFHTTYHGVEPTGAWAEWFKNIAWPVTHAILPKYLQLQLARTLFTLRYDLAALHAFEAAAVGRLLARSAWDATSRFKVFLEQEELVGRIVLALLASKAEHAPAPILTTTLRRIADDLGRARTAGEWLRETRRVVADRFEGVGRLASRAPMARAASATIQPDTLQAPQANIRPAVLLRRGSATSWSLYVEVGGFAALSRLNPDLRTFLRATRCRIRGARDLWLPAGWTLSGISRRLLQSWPGAKEPIVMFERPNGLLDHLLQSECRLSVGRIWLFRIGADDMGREIAGRFVRCDLQYIVLSETELTRCPPLISKYAINCEGIFGYHVVMPAQVTAEETARLQTFGLQVARTIRIWPAGLFSRGWDGEGRSEWLTSESPSFGIIHDHPTESYRLQLNDEVPTTITAKAPGVTTFVTLPPLSPGRHMLVASVARSSSGPSPAARAAEVSIEIIVREPIPWIPGTTSYVGMSISVDPHDPTIDDFWNEDVDLSVQGPLGHQVHCGLSLYRANGDELSNREIGSLELPISQATWSRKIHEFLKSSAKDWTHLEAASGALILRGEELGDYKLPLTRDVKPVRWACKTTHDQVLLRLVDDTGSEDPMSVTMRAFDSPLTARTINAADLYAGIKCGTPGGLFAVEKGNTGDAIIVSSPEVEGGLQSLGIKVDVGAIDPTVLDVAPHLGEIELWMKTRLAGPLASFRRDRVVRALCQLLYARLCGTRWARAETAFLENPQSAQQTDELVACVDRTPGFAIVLQRDFSKTQGGTSARARWFFELAKSFRVCADPRLIEFALLIAGQPHQVPAKEEEMGLLLSQVNDKTVLLRGARLLALLDVAKRAGGVGSAIPRWTWRS
jgi:hypothetical protein